MIRQIKAFVSKAKAIRSKKEQYRRFDGKIEKSLRDLENRKKLTREQKREIEDFYVSMTGRKVPLSSHEYFYSRTGIYSKEYIPPNLQSETHLFPDDINL